MMFKVSPGLSISALDAALDDSEAARRSSCSALGPTWNGCRGGSMLPSANFSSPFGAPGRCAAALRARRSQDGAVPARQDSAPQGLLHCRLALGMRCCSGTTGSSVSLRKGQLLVNARVQATTTQAFMTLPGGGGDASCRRSQEEMASQPHVRLLFCAALLAASAQAVRLPSPNVRSLELTS